MCVPRAKWKGKCSFFKVQHNFPCYFHFVFQNLGGYNSVLRPRVVGEWIGREEVDADPLAAEMLHPPVPRAKIEVCWSGDGSPARRLASVFVSTQACAHVTPSKKKKKEF